MLAKEDNELITRVGPGTPLGNLMRRYWVPALLSSELPGPDSDPVRVRLLGEDLVAYRDSSGRVGLIGDQCPHRGASLYFGRNEEGGLRCVYHGWKFDASGACTDMPNEPPESNFKEKIHHTAYPCHERGGVVWTHMGPHAAPPPLPDLEANNLPTSDARCIFRECNWLQALEGDIDTSHLAFLHFGSQAPESAPAGSFQYYTLADRAPRYAVVDTDYGALYGAYRPASLGQRYWRLAMYLFPFWTMIPTGVLGHQVLARAWVPVDDEHTMFYEIAPREYISGRQGPGLELLPNTTDRYGRWRLVSRKDNDYRIDRDKQRRGEEYTGIAGVPTQDQAITESMGTIYDRSTEHLGSSDAMVIRVRRRLMEAVRALADHGEEPYSALHPEVFRQRSGGIFLPEDADWLEATAELRKGYVTHPDLDPALAGRV